MNILTRLFRKHRSFVILLAAVSCPLLFTQCKTTAGSYKDVEYDPATLNTPSGHGLQKKDYPFDDSGNYRKDWVKTKATGKARSANKLPDPAPSTETEGTQVASASSGQYYGPAHSTGAAVASTPTAPPTPPPAAAPQYHKVASGDTLFSLAGRYNTSVADIKRINGLSGDTIRLGQSLRIP